MLDKWNYWKSYEQQGQKVFINNLQKKEFLSMVKMVATFIFIKLIFWKYTFSLLI